MTILFDVGKFCLNSGQLSGWKIECDALTGGDWNTLAVMAVELFGHPGRIEGVSRGGLPFAHALFPYHEESGPLWIVDDVVTTGGSLERQRAGRPAVLVAVFARTGAPQWINAIFRMPSPRPGWKTTIGVEGQDLSRTLRFFRQP